MTVKKIIVATLVFDDWNSFILGRDAAADVREVHEEDLEGVPDARKSVKRPPPSGRGVKNILLDLFEKLFVDDEVTRAEMERAVSDQGYDTSISGRISEVVKAGFIESVRPGSGRYKVKRIPTEIDRNRPGVVAAAARKMFRSVS